MGHSWVSHFLNANWKYYACLLIANYWNFYNTSFAVPNLSLSNTNTG